MMSSNDNFLLKIHMEDDDNLTELFLNKERRLFTFVNDECISDLIIPEFKITSLDVIFGNVIDNNENDHFYAAYLKDDQIITEYDKEKVLIIKDLITDISFNDFVEYQIHIKINDYYVDNIIDKYNCVLSEKLKRIVSYTTNGVTFNDDPKISMLSHKDIVNYNGPIKNFIPLFRIDNNIVVGYNYKNSLYEKYEKEEKMAEADDFEKLFKIYIDEDKEPKVVEIAEKPSEEVKIEATIAKQTDPVEVDEIIDAFSDDANYDDKIKNIDYQLERLNNGLVHKEEKEKVKPVNKVEKEQVSVETKEETSVPNETTDEKLQADIVATVRKALDAVTQTNKIIDEIDQNIKTVDEKPKKVAKDSEKDTKKKDGEDWTKLTKLVNASLLKATDNYKINFNDTHKLVVEHLPYYELPTSFKVIQIPEIENDKITLIPNSVVRLGKIELRVETLSNNSVEFVVVSAPSIIDKDDNKLKKGMHIKMNLNTELSLRLNKKGAMETWSLKLEKATFEKELRNIDYCRIMNIISQLDSYHKIGNVEKFELEKSIMLFINFVMETHDEKGLDELYRILDEEPTLYEEYVTKYNIDHSLANKDNLGTYEQKKDFVTKLNYVKGLIDAKWLDYPRFIFASYSYFDNDNLLDEFRNDLEEVLNEKDFSDYILKLFKEYKMFVSLDAVGKENLCKCLEYLSLVYKYRPVIGEHIKYEIEKEFMTGAEEEDLALLVAKLCRRGIKDYSSFVEYDTAMKEAYRTGNLKYPIFSESFGIEEIRNGGECDEY